MTTFAREASTDRPYQAVADRPARDFAWTDDVSSQATDSWTSQSHDDQAFAYRTLLRRDVHGKRFEWPVPIEVRRTLTYVSIAENRFGIHGVGASLAEATDDFYGALIEFRDTLARQEQLTPELRGMLAFVATLT